jgi:hypothetical protein
MLPQLQPFQRKRSLLYSQNLKFNPLPEMAFDKSLLLLQKTDECVEIQTDFKCHVTYGNKDAASLLLLVM